MKNSLLLAIGFMVLSCSNSKTLHDPVDLENTYWKLVELNGQPVEPPKDSNRKYYLELKPGDHSISAFAGCNGIGGNYELRQGNRIRFTNLISTMMACPALETENEFKRVLESVDNYAISGKVLSFNRARMAPLARFESVSK